MKEFVDETVIEVVSGNGGKGAISFRREKFVPFGGPDGGDGGKGGDVIFVVKHNLKTLSHLKAKKVFRAENGNHGKGKRMHGKNGDNTFIPVPPGTLIRDQDSGHILHDFSQDKETKWLYLTGGKGGQGNWHFRSSQCQAPHRAQQGLPGQSKILNVELNIIADLGFVGFPNAGKSTLLFCLTNATPKIAPYPFTTQIPNLGVMRIHDTDIVLADIPGLLPGASTGKGLGIQFLKHITRTKGLVFLIDLSEETYLETFGILLAELAAFSPALLKKPRLVLGNKSDLDDSDLHFHALRKALPQETVLKNSSVEDSYFNDLRQAFFSLATQKSQQP